MNDAKVYILRLVSENNNNVHRRSEFSSNEKKSKQIEIISSSVGRVIGRGGGTVKDIEGKHNVKLNIGD